MHAENPVEELAHLVVSLVQSQHPGAILAGGDETDSNQAVSDIYEEAKITKKCELISNGFV